MKALPLCSCWVAVFVLTGRVAAAEAAGELPYGVASWPEAGRGNHRALVRVEQRADAVRAHIPWRRRDHQPETKDIRVFDEATDLRVTNVARVRIERESGELVFQPQTVPGAYEIYYLPYDPPKANFDDAGAYFKPQDTADSTWMREHHLGPDQLADGKWKAISPAQVLRIEARGDRHRMDPMEIIATEEEIAGLLATQTSGDYLLFPEDRTNAIRMFETIPLKWARSGPGDEFRGRAHPGEFYPFQIGVWAARTAVSNLTAECTDLRSQGGQVIPASGLTAFNLGGLDWLGRSLHKSFDVGRGGVRALWFGVQIPTNALGLYEGSITIKPVGQAQRTVKLSLEVAGPVVPEGGVNDLWRLSRLKWLNSTVGLEDEVVPPFTPLEVDGNSARCLLREVRFDQSGLPEAISAQGRDLLSRPMALVVETREGVLKLDSMASQVLRQSPAKLDRRTTASNPKASWEIGSRMEFDGCVAFSAKLRAHAPLALKDVRLEIPLRREVAGYMMGMKRAGGFRPKEWAWKWDINRADNQIWIGDAQGGLQLTLPGARDVWDYVTLRDAGLPPSWWNQGRGGCDLAEQGEAVVVRAYSGERTLAAGEELEFRFRLLITPFKPIDRRHWDWRYGDVSRGGNILHVHQGGPPNSYINYPFLEADSLAEMVRTARSTPRRANPGSLSYGAGGNLNPGRGALHVWVRLNFDPAAGRARDASRNQPLFSLDFPNEDSLGFYWNVDVRGMRSYVRKGPPSLNQYPSMVDAPAPEWKDGQRHLLTLSWGEELAIYIDGKRRSAVPYRGLATNSIHGATLNFNGEGFVFDAIKITGNSFAAAQEPPVAAEDIALFFDDFTRLDGPSSLRPLKAVAGSLGRLQGTIAWKPSESGRGLHLTTRVLEGPRTGVNVYYTVRELSDHTVEMWPLRSLGDEIFQQRETFIYSVEKTMFGGAGGGYPWLREHLVAGYVPAWRSPLPDGDTDASIGTQGLSRWHNFYIEGLRWLMRHTGVDGLYLDGIGYDREIMKRVARVMHRADPGSRINFHSGNNYVFMDWKTSAMNTYMEHLPFISNLWFGELYDYDASPDYWLIEISGIPFGLTSEMLNYDNGGNAYRGMVYGMTGRQHPSAAAMWRFWDEFGIQDAEMLGYWEKRCPVRTGRDDVLATSYVKKGRTLVALASWAKDPARIRLRVDWAALGLDPQRARLQAPAIEQFQEAQSFELSDELPVSPGKGRLLILGE